MPEEPPDEKQVKTKETINIFNKLLQGYKIGNTQVQDNQLMNFRLPEFLKVYDNDYESTEKGKTMFMDRLTAGKKRKFQVQEKLIVKQAAGFRLNKDVFSPKSTVRHQSAFPKI